jgi:hypothetical protein
MITNGLFGYNSMIILPLKKIEFEILKLCDIEKKEVQIKRLKI